MDALYDCGFALLRRLFDAVDVIAQEGRIEAYAVGKLKMIPARVRVIKKRPGWGAFLLRDGLGLFAEFEGGVVGYGHVDAAGEVVNGYGVGAGGYLDAGGVVDAYGGF